MSTNNNQLAVVRRLTFTVLTNPLNLHQMLPNSMSSRSVQGSRRIVYQYGIGHALSLEGTQEQFVNFFSLRITQSSKPGLGTPQLFLIVEGDNSTHGKSVSSSPFLTHSNHERAWDLQWDFNDVDSLPRCLSHRGGQSIYFSVPLFLRTHQTALHADTDYLDLRVFRLSSPSSPSQGQSRAEASTTSIDPNQESLPASGSAATKRAQYTKLESTSPSCPAAVVMIQNGTLPLANGPYEHKTRPGGASATAAASPTTTTSTCTDVNMCRNPRRMLMVHAFLNSRVFVVQSRASSSTVVSDLNVLS
ncbi:hypothetical protein R3P38DRAFT_3215600 [Favolaschia claudopus]|uniref:Uncharacterized protein n=1 Tax=Favolaschia claudopus TaxID=2862362 RepID=A0AAW0A985_9AGAR